MAARRPSPDAVTKFAECVAGADMRERERGIGAQRDIEGTGRLDPAVRVQEGEPLVVELLRLRDAGRDGFVRDANPCPQRHRPRHHLGHRRGEWAPCRAHQLARRRRGGCAPADR